MTRLCLAILLSGCCTIPKLKNHESREILACTGVVMVVLAMEGGETP